MPGSVGMALALISVTFVVVGGYYRVQSQRSGERLDRTKEGWPILIGIRLSGLLTIVCTAVWIWRPALLPWAAWPVADGVRWIGVTGFAGAVAWLLWMFHTLGRNLTDTVVTRKDAYFVDWGPYRFVRNPMYTGVLATGVSVGVAAGTWVTAVGGAVMFLLFAIRTRTEEHYLIERFGDQYRTYMGRVGRFWPKLS